jgi:tRNA(Ile)-lysidine synthase
MAYRSFLPMFSESIPIVRPLLATWRQEIDEYYLSEGLQPCSDDTNNDIRYFRNRIRRELIPELETYNSQSKQHLWQLSMLMQPENEMLEEMMKNALSLLTSSSGKGFIAFKRSGFAGTPLPVKRRLLRRMIADLRADLRDIGYDAVEKGIGFSEQETGKGECQLLDNVWLTRLSEDELMLFTKEADFCELFPLMDPKKKVTLTVPGITTLNDHWEVAAALETDGDATGRHICENEENFDLAELGDSLFFRTPMTGERIDPFGKAPISQKLSDLFINLGILRRARERWALLYSDERLIWVVGLRRAKYAPVQPQTKKILKLKLQKRN